MISLELSAHGFQTTEKREDGLPAAVVAVYGTVGADEAAKATEQFNRAGVTVTVLANECIGGFRRASCLSKDRSIPKDSAI